MSPPQDIDLPIDIEKLCDQVIDSALDLGEEITLNSLKDKVLRLSRFKANPHLVQAVLSRKLEEGS